MTEAGAGNRTRYRLANVVQSVVLVLGMALLFGVCGWIVAGLQGLVSLLIAGAVLLIATRRASPVLLLRSIGARPVAPDDAPEIFAALGELARRADLPELPRLCVVPWEDMTAFTIGRRPAPYIIVSAGMLSGLGLREIVAVLAHEVAHIRNNDMWILGLADTVTRLTRFASTFGLILLFLNLPLLAAGGVTVSWLLIFILIFAPTASTLLQLGLARTREFEADLEAAELSGDPRGLAQALDRLERGASAAWEALFGYGWRNPVPSLLRSHPETAERVARLLALTPRHAAIVPRHPRQIALPGHLTSFRRPIKRWPRARH